MAALSAIRTGKVAPGLVQPMRSETRPGKIITIAVARELLIIANVVVRDQRAFQMT